MLEFALIQKLLILTLAIPFTQGLMLLTKGKSKLATSMVGDVKELKGLTGNDGLRISKNVILCKEKTYEGVLVVGPTGAGKTSSIFYPNLLNDAIKGSIIVIDPKGELYRDTRAYQKSIGREIMVLRPLEPENSSKYNLLSECRNTTEVIQLAQCILINGSKSFELKTGVKAGGVEWLNMATPLWAASLLYVREQGYPMNTISSALRLIIRHTDEELQLLLTNAGKEISDQFHVFEMSLQSPNTASSIKTTLATNLQLFLDKNIEHLTSRTDFTAEKFRKKPTILYICYEVISSDYLSPFIATFFTQMINHLLSKEGKDGLPIIFMADELANIGMIAGFSGITSTCRSAKMGWLCCLQSISQLVQIYGRDNSKSILNNLLTKCVLPGISDPETLKFLSELMGETEIKVKSTSTNGKNTTTSYSTTKKQLFNSDELCCLKDGEVLIKSHNRHPVLDQQDTYFLNSDYTSKIKLSY